MASYKVQPGDLCIWCISGTFFLLLVSGGVLLALYMVLPESKTTMWFPAVGVILVGIPWVFWIITCFHRSMTRGKPSEDRPNVKVGVAAPAPVVVTAATATRESDLPANSTGGASPVAPAVPEAAIEEGTSSEQMNRDSERADASIASHESETPLALSMS